MADSNHRESAAFIYAVASFFQYPTLKSIQLRYPGCLVPHARHNSSMSVFSQGILIWEFSGLYSIE